MKLLTSTILAVSLLASSMAFAQNDKEVAEARVATERWMKLMDTEEYAAAWNNSSAGLRKDMSKFTWSMVGNAAHLALGEFKARTLTAAKVKHASAGKPESVSFEYVSNYSKNPKVYETITAIHETDGVWRVTGYSFTDEKK
jgi:Ni/Co efflux regulator RcnB